MIAISSRSQYAPAWSATNFTPSVKSTARLIAWRYQFSLPVNCAKSALLSVFDIVVLRIFRAGLPESGGVPSQRSRHRLATGHPASRGTREAREQRSALIGENDGLGSREEASPPFCCVCRFLLVLGSAQ